MDPEQEQQVPAETPVETEVRATPELSPRARAEKEIADAAAARRVAEAAERIEGMEPAPAPESQSGDEETQTGDAAQAGRVGQETVEAEDPEVEIVVSGQTMKVKQSQIFDAGRRTLQKETAADFKLEMASKLLRDAEALAVGKQPPAPRADAQMPAGEPQAVQGKSDAELAKQIQYGTEEQAAEAIKEIRRRDGVGLTKDSLQAALAELLPSAVGNQVAFHNAIQRFQGEYKDIFGDQHLATLFHVQEARARNAGDVRPPEELWKDIGDGIRKHFKLTAPTPSSGPTLADKAQAKASAPSMPKAAATRVDKEPGRTPTPGEVRDNVLEKMAKARGQRIR